MRRRGACQCARKGRETQQDNLRKTRHKRHASRYLRKPAKGEGGDDENTKPAFVSSSSAGRSHRFGAAGRRGSVTIQIPDVGEQKPQAISINFSDLE